MDKLDQKLAFELGSEILNKKRNDIYKIKIKDWPSLTLFLAIQLAWVS